MVLTAPRYYRMLSFPFFHNSPARDHHSRAFIYHSQFKRFPSLFIQNIVFPDCYILWPAAAGSLYSSGNGIHAVTSSLCHPSVKFFPFQNARNGYAARLSVTIYSCPQWDLRFSTSILSQRLNALLSQHNE